MGGNGSYSKEHGGIPTAYRTHTDTGHRLEGHKVLVLSSNRRLTKIPMNSNSEHPVYLIAKTDKDGILSITKVAIYENHKISKVIDIEFDGNGKSKDFANGKGTHMHNWKEDTNGNIGRKRHDKSNSFPVSSDYQSLICSIEKFNQEKNKI